MAVKVTLVPEQMVVAVAETVTETGRLGFTVMVTEFDVAGLPLTQVAFEVRTQLTISEFTNALFK